MTDLAHQKCVPCEGGTLPLTREQFSAYLPQVTDWQIEGDKSLSRQFEFKNFRTAMGFVTQVGLLAEKEGHHPDIYLRDYKFVIITFSTHAIGGLSINDFVMAVKINEIMV
ncbi:MAG: 4a-hydroxytetrahydrobiopterin dehydratase [Patescibacteria group bacterium]